MSHTFKKDAFNYWCWHCACCERLKKKKKKKPFLLSNAASILTELFLDWKFLNKLSTIKVERNVMAGGK